jgi:hypothetical protein
VFFAISEAGLSQNALVITSSWLWDFGYDIQHHGLHKWACKDCILVNRPTIASFTSSGLQNAANHLWREHKTPAPEGEKKSTAQLKSEGALKSSQPTIASVLKLDVNKPTEQNIANCFISRFNKQHFQRMLAKQISSVIQDGLGLPNDPANVSRV